MTAARLSPAQRNALYAVCLGGLRNRQALPTKAVQTLDSLRAKGFLDADYQPTDTGRAVFAGTSHRGVTYNVWHLSGPQGCGKSMFAATAAEVINAHGGHARWFDADTLHSYFAGNPERVRDVYPDLTVLMIEDHAESSAPRYYMNGERIIDLSTYAESLQRRPAVGKLLTLALLKNPTWRGIDAMLHVKVHYDRLVAELQEQEASHA